MPPVGASGKLWPFSVGEGVSLVGCATAGVCGAGAQLVEKDYEEAAGRIVYAAARLNAAYYGCVLKAGRAFNVAAMYVLREVSGDVWPGGVKDWPKRRVIGVCDGVGDHAHSREVELEAVGSEHDLSLASRIQAMCHTKDMRRMRNKVPLPVNSCESACGHDDTPFG